MQFFGSEIAHVPRAHMRFDNVANFWWRRCFGETVRDHKHAHKLPAKTDCAIVSSDNVKCDGTVPEARWMDGTYQPVARGEECMEIHAKMHKRRANVTVKSHPIPPVAVQMSFPPGIDGLERKSWQTALIRDLGWIAVASTNANFMDRFSLRHAAALFDSARISWAHGMARASSISGFDASCKPHSPTMVALSASNSSMSVLDP